MNNVAVNCQIPIPSSKIKPSESPFIRSHGLQFLNVQLLKRCSHLIQFKQIHSQIIKSPFDRTDFMLAKLVESLVGLNHMEYACRVFEQMADPSAFVFNIMVRGYALNGVDNEGIHLFIRMQHRGLQPDNFTYPFLLKACTVPNQGKCVHSLILKSSGFGSNIYSQTSLVSFYSSYGDLEYARSVFDRMPERNVVSWTAMMTGYMKKKKYTEGLALFHRMQIEGIEMNELTLVNVLSACAHLGASEMGKWVHNYISRNRVFLNPTLASALVDMYAKCGHIHKASQVFENLSQRSVCTWNSIIGGLAMHGYVDEALGRFKQMQISGTRPNSITFIGVLSACTHSGMVDEGREYFYSMQRDYGIEPNIKHYGCLVDLLGKAGHLDEAYEIMKNMPTEPNEILWGTLLNACGSYANVELAETAMEKLVKLEPFNDGNYVLMSNIYAAKGQWTNVAKMRRLMKDRGLLKTPGCSSIEVNNVRYEFMVRDSRHPLSREIYSMLDDVALKLKDAGYVPKTSQLLMTPMRKRKG